MAKSKTLAHKPPREGTVVFEKLELPASVVADLYALHPDFIGPKILEQECDQRAACDWVREFALWFNGYFWPVFLHLHKDELPAGPGFGWTLDKTSAPPQPPKWPPA
jgi:hypothetical protein